MNAPTIVEAAINGATSPRANPNVPYTPEQVSLQDWKHRGRWFAGWWKPEAPEDAPEDERWEFLLIEEDKHRPGTLFYQEL